MEKTWTPNETQKRFLEVLGNYPDGTTLAQIKIDTGIEFKTGSINNVHMKEKLEITDGEFKCDLVFNGVKIGETTKSWKVYKLK